MGSVMQKLSAVIFDFDYTLGDSSEGVVHCVNEALGKLDLPEADPEEIKKTIGFTLEETFIKLNGEDQRVLAKDFVSEFVKEADRVMLGMTRVYSTTHETIEALRTIGYSLGVVSTKYGYRIRDILRRESILNSFDVIVGGDSVLNQKPDPEGLLSAVESLQIKPENAIYVGDSIVDARTAESAGVPFVAVTTGTTPSEDFQSFRPFAVIDSLSDLPALLIR